MAKKKRTKVMIWAVRRAIADYMRNVGCGCCANHKKAEAAAKRIAKMLDVPLYDDNSGYDFEQFQTKK